MKLLFWAMPWAWRMMRVIEDVGYAIYRLWRLFRRWK